jgi:pimeloyl-ACP methyl ester carboxylesterase
MANSSSKTYILIHGAWHGSWCWHKVARRLQNLGHRVLTPDLPGHYHTGQYHIGQGDHPWDFRAITLQSYVAHIEGLVAASSQPVVLVGHSMAGVVITQVAENMPDKIEQLIYLSGFILEDGGSLMDEEQQASVPTVTAAITIDEATASINLPTQSPERIVELFYGQSSPEDAWYALAHVQPQPLLPFGDPVSVSASRFGRVPKLYIECLQDQAILIQDQRRMHSRTNCAVASINTDHAPFFSAEEQLTGLLLDA